MSASTTSASLPPELLLRLSHDAVFTQDATGAVSVWNRSAERVFGLAESTILGVPFAHLLAEERRPAWEAVLARAAAGERIENEHLILNRADGQPVHAAVSLSPLLDRSGGAAGLLVLVHDRTEQVLAQQTLAESEQQVRRSEALARAGSFVLDARDLAEQWSEGMYRIHGVLPEDFEVSREGHLGLVHPDDRDTVATAMDAALREGVADELDHRVVRPDGELVWAFLAVEPTRDDAGRVIGLRGVCQDITARRRLDILKDEFLATVSHELRTPLTSILGFASVLRRLAPEHEEYLERIERNGWDMRRMIERLLDYSRLQAGQMAFEPRPVALADEVRRCLTQFESAPGDQTLVNEVPADVRVVIDPDALNRILTNLVGNACKYSGAGSTVRVAAELRDGVAVISVSDTGPGIPAEHQHRLFERFFQVPDSTTRRGTGIGLAIVQHDVHQHGGTVWCESAEGTGTTFVCSIPQPSEVVP